MRPPLNGLFDLINEFEPQFDSNAVWKSKLRPKQLEKEEDLLQFILNSYDHMVSISSTSNRIQCGCSGYSNVIGMDNDETSQNPSSCPLAACGLLVDKGTYSMTRIITFDSESVKSDGELDIFKEWTLRLLIQLTLSLPILQRCSLKKSPERRNSGVSRKNGRRISVNLPSISFSGFTSRTSRTRPDDTSGMDIEAMVSCIALSVESLPVWVFSGLFEAMLGIYPKPSHSHVAIGVLSQRISNPEILPIIVKNITHASICVRTQVLTNLNSLLMTNYEQNGPFFLQFSQIPALLVDLLDRNLVYHFVQIGNEPNGCKETQINMVNMIISLLSLICRSIILQSPPTVTVTESFESIFEHIRTILPLQLAVDLQRRILNRVLKNIQHANIQYESLEEHQFWNIKETTRMIASFIFFDVSSDEKTTIKIHMDDAYSMEDIVLANSMHHFLETAVQYLQVYDSAQSGQHLTMLQKMMMKGFETELSFSASAVGFIKALESRNVNVCDIIAPTLAVDLSSMGSYTKGKGATMGRRRSKFSLLDSSSRQIKKDLTEIAREVCANVKSNKSVPDMPSLGNTLTAPSKRSNGRRHSLVSLRLPYSG